MLKAADFVINKPTMTVKEAFANLGVSLPPAAGYILGQAASAIGNMLDCVPHEDISGYVYMVPNWAHKWFRHRGYVSTILGHE